MEDRRQFQRFCLDRLVRISTETVCFETELLDLSFKGVLVAMPQRHGNVIEQLDRLFATIVLAPTVIIEMAGKVAHLGSNTFGFHCTSLNPNCASRLSRFIESNVGHTDVLESHVF